MTDIIFIKSKSEAVVIVPQPEAVIVEVVERGPPGLPGAKGDPGEDGSVFPPGNDGDIIRYNEATGEWESRSEPFEFQGIVLVPMALPGSPIEGFVGYNIADNSLYVAVD